MNQKELDQLIHWMIAGQSGDVIEEALKHHFPKSDHKSLMFRAGEHFEQVGSADQAFLVGWCLEATRDLYQKMVAVGDFSGALKAVKQLRDFTK